MSSTQIELGRIDTSAVIASFNHNMSVGREELSLVMRESTNSYKEEHLNKAKYHFMNAIRNAQGAINPRTKDGIDFLNIGMLNEAVSELCNTLNKSIIFSWRDSRPVLNITELHPYDPSRRQEYNNQEYSVIASVDCGKLPWEKKQEIAAQICTCIEECLTGYKLSALKRQEYSIHETKELHTLLKISWHYILPNHYDKAIDMALKVRGFDFE